MERDAERGLLVVADASFLINFLVADWMDILGKLPGLRFHQPRESGGPARRAAGATRGRHGCRVVTEIEITDPAEVRLYDEFRGSSATVSRPPWQWLSAGGG